MPSLTGAALTRLEELKKEIEIEARKLSDITSESSRVTSDNEMKRMESVRLDASNAEKLSEWQVLLGKITTTETDYDNLLEKMRDGESAVTVSQRRKDALDREANSLVVEMGTLTANLKKKREEFDGVTLLLSDKTEAYRVLVSNTATIETELGSLRDEILKLIGKKGRIISAIENALKQFHIFESRIGQLSLETGYIIAYEPPEQLLDNEISSHG